MNKDNSIPSKPNLTPILAVNLIGTMGYSIVLPFLIIIVLKFGGNELAYGILGATYSFFQLIGAPILGSWSDRYGRRRVLLLSQAGTFLAWVIFMVALVAPNQNLINLNDSFIGPVILTLPLLLLFAARALDGLTGGNVSVANAYLADVSTDADRTLNFGKMAASANVGFIIGPALAGLLGNTQFGEVLPVAMALVISLVAIFLIQFQLKESKPCVLAGSADPKKLRKLYGMEIKECHEIEGASSYRLRDIVKLPSVMFLLVLYFLTFLGFNFFYVSFPVYTARELGWSILQLGIFFSVLGGVMVLVQGPVLKRASRIVSDKWLVVSGFAMLSIAFILLRVDTLLSMGTGVILFASGNGLMWPSLLSIVSKSAEQRYQGAIQGIASSAGSLASIVGLILGGIIYGSLEGNTLLIPAIIMAVLFILAFRLNPQKISATE